MGFGEKVIEIWAKLGNEIIKFAQKYKIFYIIR